MRKPYVILIGSASGIGKSTVASELAKELNIKHLIETDFIREIVRGIIGPDYAPALHKSSFDAYTTLRDKERFRNNNIESLICAGFEEHASFVIPAVEKVIERAVADSDDVAIEGVHLLPGLLNIEKFEEIASIHFFVLSAEENVHKERFVKRAMEVKRGGKHLEYFRENRVIHDYLVRKAREHDVPVINNDDIKCTIKRMLSFIRENCTEVTLQHPVERLAEVIDIIIKRHGGRIVDVSYPIPGFSQPLKREVNVYDPVEAERFLKRLNESPKRKRDLERLYTLSDNIHSHRICAPDPESLQAIVNELKESGLIYQEEN
ncbi:3H domain-containing protein [Methanothermobacter sp.]|uniref:3H domain-containing protein n=1 Tax=Methanothermobacter sp. TaxID=1884223 RepID=UPI00261CA7EB|nr:3H domain-containing protein [Methanothermobacter sp.]MDI9618957.1 3H domain-containing protein [Methanothermobacter sp.]